MRRIKCIDAVVSEKYSDKKLLEDLVGIMSSFVEEDFFTTMPTLRKIITLRPEFPERCQKIFRDERYISLPPMDKRKMSTPTNDFEVEEEINSYIFGISSMLDKGIIGTHPKKDSHQRKILFSNLSLLFPRKEIKDYVS